MICKVKHIDRRDKKLSGLSKGLFLVGEVVAGEDAKILGKLGVAVDEKEYDRISKEKGTLPIRKTVKQEK